MRQLQHNMMKKIKHFLLDGMMGIETKLMIFKI